MKKVVQYIILLILTALLAWGILWARAKARTQVCHAIVVDVLNTHTTPFVTPEAVKEELDHHGIAIVGKAFGDIDIDTIETLLRHSPYVEDTECFLSYDGSLHIKVRQLVPVLRVFDGNTSYYVNREGKTMRATPTYHADVPIVNGHFTSKFPVTRLLPLVEYVEKDSVLKALVTMYNVVDSNNVFIVPAIAGHVVNLGPPTGFENKFKKLQLFYHKVMPARGWETYDTISVKWNYQVVATLRHKKVKHVEVYNPEDDDPAPDHATMTIDDATAPQPAQRPKPPEEAEAKKTEQKST